MAETMYNDAKDDLFEFMKNKNASHYHRLSKFGWRRISGIAWNPMEQMYFVCMRWKAG
jgi:hypothetical protein